MRVQWFSTASLHGGLRGAVTDKDKTGKQLERRVAAAYRRMGAWKIERDVEMDGSQIDVYVELHMPGRALHRTAVEAKDWSDPVGIGVVRDVAAVVKDLRDAKLVDEGIIVSAVGFTRPARNCAGTHQIRLLEIADLEAMAEQTDEPDRSKEKTAAIIYGDFGDQTTDLVETDSLEILADHAGMAFELALAERR